MAGTGRCISRSIMCTHRSSGPGTLRAVRRLKGHLMLIERILPRSEVIRAILVEYSPCCGVPDLVADVVGRLGGDGRDVAEPIVGR